MNEGTVSIILPVFNRGKTIVRTINSVINQTYQKWELIIIDDASTDNTKSILRQFNDQRIRLIEHQYNCGPAKSRNDGLNAMEGEFVAFIDSDDTFDANLLEEGVKLLKLKNADVAVYDIKNIYGHKVSITCCGKSAFNSFPGVCNKLYRSQLWNNIRFDSDNFVEDFPILPLPLLKSGKNVKVNTTFYNYFHNSNSLSHSSRSVSDQLRIIDDVKCLILNLNSIGYSIQTNNDIDLMTYVDYQLSEHFWRGVKDAKTTRDIKLLFKSIAFYSKQFNQRYFNHNHYFYHRVNNLSHFVRDQIIVQLFAMRLYWIGWKLYFLISKAKR